jgi:phosphorylcholine metabolism protein LicD
MILNPFIFLDKQKRKAERQRKKTFRFQKNIDKSLDILEKTIKVLNRHNIDYYLDFGTLLGAIRDKALIPWDDDIDITIFNEEDYFKINQVLKNLEKENLNAWAISFLSTIVNRKEKLKLDKSENTYVDFDGIHFTNIFYYM